MSAPSIVVGKCEMGHDIELVNEGFGICHDEKHPRWFAWCFNAENPGGFSAGFLSDGSRAWVSMTLWSRDDAEQCIDGAIRTIREMRQ